MNIKRLFSITMSILLVVAVFLNLQVASFADDDAEALLSEGWNYFNGNGVPQDYYKGIDLMVQAANAGSVDAMLQIGYFCAYGFAPYIEENFEPGTEGALALSWFTKVAEAGDPDNAGAAMIDLAYSYLIGDESASIQEDPVAAFNLFSKAEEIGVYSANDILGVFYTYGSVVERDADKALDLFLEGARAGYKDCEYAIEQYAYDYYSGADFLIDINFGTAFKYYEALIEFNNPRAMYNVGLLYLHGLGVSQDPDKAVEWLTRASEAGFELADSALSALS